MKGALALRKPVGFAFLDTSSTSVTSGAYVTFVTAANMKKGASAIGIHNPGSSPLKLAMGAAGAEVDQFVIPINNWALIPVELLNGVRLSLESLGATQSSGIITATFFQ